MQTVEVVVVRPLVAQGSSWAKGATFKVAPLVASALVASGRAELVRAADQAALSEAENRHTMQACPLESSRGRFPAHR